MAVFLNSSYHCPMMLEKYLLDVIEGKRSSPVVSRLLALLSKPYRLAIKGRHFAYRKKWLSTCAAGIPTVSIGNIVVGGTGKTPLVQKLTRALQTEGKIAILTRGFRSQAEKCNEPICIDKNHPVSAELCGDEPLFLSQTTGASVWVGRNRVLSAKRAKTDGAACLILDDGFQHRKLDRDIEIVAIDAHDPFGQHRFLPHGLLRDLPERLQEADLIVANHTRDVDHYRQVKKELLAYTQAPVVAMQHLLVESLPLQGRRVGAFCGIGKPHYFFEALNRTGAEIVAHCALLDHQSFPIGQLEAFADTCAEQGATDIVCTEKDWVKLEPEAISHLLERGIQIHPIAMRLEIIAGGEHWDSIIEKIKQKMRDC